MKRADTIVVSFDKVWNEFSEAWKEARAKKSERSIHDLRVSTRRMISALELVRVLSRSPEIAKLQGRFKKLLKATGALRDLQVQLEKVSELPQNELVLDFKRTLKRRERRAIDGASSRLKRGMKHSLKDGLKEVRSVFVKLREKPDESRIQHSVERVLTSRQNEFLRAKRRFDPSNEDALHAMRLALKRLRYTLEAAQPILGNSARKRARQMHRFQQLFGDARDVELLRTKLEKWASKKGKTIAVVPAVDRLAEIRDGLMKEIVESAAAFDNLLPTETLKPVVEKTQAIGAGTTARAAAASATSR
jgi:CHAD domain-containing protein